MKDQYYTVEVWKKDKRTKKGERMVEKTDFRTKIKEELVEQYEKSHPKEKGFDIRIFQTYVVKKNWMSGKDFEERYDTPYYCSPSCETYFSR